MRSLSLWNYGGLTVHDTAALAGAEFARGAAANSGVDDFVVGGGSCSSGYWSRVGRRGAAKVLFTPSWLSSQWATLGRDVSAISGLRSPTVRVVLYRRRRSSRCQHHRLPRKTNFFSPRNRRCCPKGFSSLSTRGCCSPYCKERSSQCSLIIVYLREASTDHLGGHLSRYRSIEDVSRVFTCKRSSAYML